MLDQFRWLVIRDESVRQALADPIREIGRLSQERFGHLVAPATLASGRHLLDVVERVPVFVAACMIGAPGPSNAERSAFYGSVYPAVWNLQLALRSRGLGSTIVNYHLAGREEQVAELLAIPPGVTQVCLLAVARLRTDDFRPADRPPVEDVTYDDVWGNPHVA